MKKVINRNNMGTILFTSYDNIDNIDITDYPVKLQIVRFINKGLNKDFKHISDLSPSIELFQKTMNKWKKLIFTKKEKEIMSQGKTGTWFDLYKIEFQKEKNNDIKFKIAYDRLKYYLNNGVNIVAICYCEDANKCHRKIIAQMLIDEGYTVLIT